MSDELLLDGKQYVSSKRASDLSDYAQDYIGQLARKGLIDAQRVGGLWYVHMDSLLGYRKNAEEYKPQAPQYTAPAKDPESFVTFDGKDYVSASRAAKITGYNQDYIGQLARKGAILSRQVGNRWYVDREGLQSHKREKDALLAAVQSEAVGIMRQDPIVHVQRPQPIPHIPAQAQPVRQPEVATYLKYVSENRDLMPRMPEKTAVMDTYGDLDPAPQHDKSHSIPIRVNRAVRAMPAPLPPVQYTPVQKSGKTIFTAAKVVTALTFVIMISVGVVQLKDNSTYAITHSPYAASVYNAVARVGDMLENVLVTELVYRRAQ